MDDFKVNESFPSLTGKCVPSCMVFSSSGLSLLCYLSVFFRCMSLFSRRPSGSLWITSKCTPHRLLTTKHPVVARMAVIMISSSSLFLEHVLEKAGQEPHVIMELLAIDSLFLIFPMMFPFQGTIVKLHLGSAKSVFLLEVPRILHLECRDCTGFRLTLSLEYSGLFGPSPK